MDDLLNAARAAAHRIAARRVRHHDPDLERFPDVDQLTDVVEYVARYQRVDPAALADDQVDLLTILRYTTARTDQLRQRAMTTARSLHVTWRELAQALGLRSPQAAEQLLLRLEAAADDRYGVRDAPTGRAARRHVDQHLTHPVIGVARNLLACRHLVPDDLADTAGVDLDDVDERLPADGQPITDGLVAVLRLIVKDLLGRREGVDQRLRTLAAQAVLVLPDTHADLASSSSL